MSAMNPRLLFRRTHLLRQSTLRHNSTTTQKAAEAASNTSAKAKEVASTITSKAAQGLSRVTSSAGPALSGAANAVSNTLGKIGSRTGRLIQFVEAKIPPTIYYSKVGLELTKAVYRGQKMSLPNLSQFSAYATPLLQPRSLIYRLSHLNPQQTLSRVRNLDRAQMVSAGVLTAEVLGFFTVGEMLGRMKIVGYNGDKTHAGH